MNLDKYDNNLTKLVLYYQRLNIIPDLSRFKNLKDLSLDNNNISDIQPLQYLTKLEYLYLHDNNISDITSLQYLTNLEELWLNNNKISDIHPLQYLTKLKKLTLSIELFIVKEINTQLSINQEIDNEMIKQVYQIYTKDEIKEYENKVKEKYKDYKFIRWITY